MFQFFASSASDKIFGLPYKYGSKSCHMQKILENGSKKMSEGKKQINKVTILMEHFRADV
jgi:hypothetical protein